jgi:hypothetical protein
MLCQCPLTKEKYAENIGIEKLFASDKFFSELQFIDEYTYDSIKELNEIYNIAICSMGTALNISKKIIWIDRHLPFVKKFRYIDLYSNKSEVMPKNSILVDDRDKNLIYSGVYRPICFVQREFEWNRSWGGEKVYNWLELTNLLKQI